MVMGKIIVLPKHGKKGLLGDVDIRTVRDLQIHLQKIFEEANHQTSILVKLYKLLFPDWENIQRIEGYPEVGQGLWDYICNLFIEFDRVNHPECFNGGLWLNNGFASNDRLDPWAISLENCRVVYS